MREIVQRGMNQTAAATNTRDFVMSKTKCRNCIIGLSTNPHWSGKGEKKCILNEYATTVYLPGQNEFTWFEDITLIVDFAIRQTEERQKEMPIDSERA